MLLPHAISPMDLARMALSLKHAAAAATLGVNAIAAPKPTHIAWERKKW